MKGVASEQAAKSLEPPAFGAETDNGKTGVFGTGRLEAAGGGKVGRNDSPVALDEKDQSAGGKGVVRPARINRASISSLTSFCDSSAHGFLATKTIQAPDSGNRDLSWR